MRLETFISDLLYRYDLVIIPDFGGIVSRKKSARFDRDSYIFSPPHKELSFNRQLRENDGLLANYVSDIMQISYSEALGLIASEVASWQETLNNDKRLKLEQIGIFNLVAGDKIIFLPLTTKNYLAEAYGLTSFVHKPILKHQQISIPVEESPIPSLKEQQTSPVIPKRRPKKVNRQNDYKLWKYAAVFIVGLGLFTAGIGWIKSHNHVSEPQFQKATFVLKKDFPAVTIQSFESPKIKVEKKPEAEKEYFIIGGAFRNKSNAEKKLKYLKKAGFPASIIGQNKYGLWMVALQGFPNINITRQNLIKFNKYQPGLWVYVKK